jgi:hypothetical protein
MATKSEELFETFLTANGIEFARIEEAQNQKGARRPDYLVQLGTGQLVFEVKQLGDDAPTESTQRIQSWSSTPGEALRHLITRSKKQVQFGADQGIPSILLVYNNIDPVFQTRGTDAFDFRTAMYGELTMLIDKCSDQSSEYFHGRKSQLQEGKNTSFSAIGHLCDRGGTTTLRLWENAFAKIPLPFEQLPACFTVQRVEIDNSPLSYSERE